MKIFWRIVSLATIFFTVGLVLFVPNQANSSSASKNLKNLPPPTNCQKILFQRTSVSKQNHLCKSVNASLESRNTKTPLSRLLNPDGTLNSGAGFFGAIDPTGFRLVSDPGKAPRFAPDRLADTGDENWLGDFDSPGLVNEVVALAMDHSGNLYAGGYFFDAGGTPDANYIAKWDGTRWSALGNGLEWGPYPDPPVAVLVVDQNDNLYAGGEFTATGDGMTVLNRVAKWDGTQWSALGSGLNAPVYALAIDNNGNLYAGGFFTKSGDETKTLPHVAVWDGTHWKAIGDGLNGWVGTLTLDDNGNLFAGGRFTSSANGSSISDRKAFTATSTPAARSFESSRRPLPHNQMLPLPEQRLKQGAMNSRRQQIKENGLVQSSPETTTLHHIAKWDGVQWTALGSGLGQTTQEWVNTIVVADNDNLIVGGKFTATGDGSVVLHNLARWDGTKWTPIGNGLGGENDGVITIVFNNTGNLLVGGWFTKPEDGTITLNNIARWDGTSWSPFDSGLGRGSVDYVDVIWTTGDNALYVGGYFVKTGNNTKMLNYIAKWNSEWIALGNLGNGLGGPVTALTLDENGNLYAGGLFDFTADQTVRLNRIGKWDGTQWSPLGSGLKCSGDCGALFGAHIWSIAVDHAGNVIVGGEFNSTGDGVTPLRNIAKWDGNAWTSVGSGLGPDEDQGVNALVFDANGTLHAGGYFLTTGDRSTTLNNIAKWDGTNWLPVGNGFDDAPISLVFDTVGNLYASGWFTASSDSTQQLNHVAKWDGTKWSKLGVGLGIDWEDTVNVLRFDQNGNLYAAGAFTSSGPPNPSPSDQVNNSGGEILTPTPTPLGRKILNHVAKWDGSQWNALGHGLSQGYYDTVSELVFDPLGNLYVGGSFTASGDGKTKLANVAHWDGVNWHALGSGIGGPVYAFASNANPDLFVGGWFHRGGNQPSWYIARWNGTPPIACNSKPMNPILSKPKNGATLAKRKVLFDWNDAHCVETYTLMVRAGSKTGWKVLTEEDLTVSQLKTKLPSGMKYFWRVKAYSPFGSSASKWSSFTVK